VGVAGVAGFAEVSSVQVALIGASKNPYGFPRKPVQSDRDTFAHLLSGKFVAAQPTKFGSLTLIQSTLMAN
jgi:hypothetical protein